MAKFRIAILCSVLTVGALIASYILRWHFIKHKDTVLDNTYENSFFWTEMTAKVSGSLSDSETTKSYDDLNLDNVAKTFNSCLAFLCAGMATILFALVVQIVCFFKKKVGGCGKLLVWIIAGVPVAMLIIALLTALNLPKAFKDDNYCPGVYTSSDEWCDSFKGSNSGTGYDDSWGPGEGWWCCFAATVLAGIGFICTLCSNRLW